MKSFLSIFLFILASVSAVAQTWSTGDYQFNRKKSTAGFEVAELLAGSNVTITWDNTAKTATIASTNPGGTVTSVAATDSTGIDFTVANPTTTPTLSLALTSAAVGLGSVENTALSTWAGSTALTTLGTITTGTWSATNISLAKGGTGATLTDPNADRLLFWDDSAGQMTWLTAGSGLTITGTTITASGGIGGTLGTTDNVVPRSNGTGGVTLQASALSIDDNGLASTSGASSGFDTQQTQSTLTIFGTTMRPTGVTFLWTDAFDIPFGGLLSAPTNTPSQDFTWYLPSATGNLLLTDGDGSALTGITVGQVAGAIADGGALVTGLTFPSGGLNIKDSDGNQFYQFNITSNATADQTFNLNLPDAETTLQLTGNATISGTNTGDQTTVSGNSGTTTAALGLKTASTTVSIDSATAPSSGQVLTATGSTAATWQTPSTVANPAGSGSELQFRSSGSAFGAATNSSVSGGAITLGNAEALGTTSTARLTVANTTAAAAGAQQVSPSIVLEGRGWKTDSTAGSQIVRFRENVLPVQGAANPSANWRLQSEINNSGSWTDALSVTSSGGVNLVEGASASSIWPLYFPTSQVAMYMLTASKNLTFRNIAAGDICGVDCSTTTPGFSLAAQGHLSWGSISYNAVTSRDLFLYRDAAATLAQRNGSTSQSLRIYDTYTSASDYHRLAMATVRISQTATAGATITLTGLIPDGAVVMGVTTKVTTALTGGVTGYQIGTGADPDRWGVAATATLGTTTDNRDWTNGTIECFTAATDVILTATGASFSGTGVIYVSIQYMAGQSD